MSFLIGLRFTEDWGNGYTRLHHRDADTSNPPWRLSSLRRYPVLKREDTSLAHRDRGRADIAALIPVYKRSFVRNLRFKRQRPALFHSKTERCLVGRGRNWRVRARGHARGARGSG